MEEVKLLGFWSSPYVCRVKWALQMKGVDYEYIEEHLPNKSPLLLQYNPVHKKVPVLVHGGNSISESTVILEYIEQTWPEKPLLPGNPYEMAEARFWTKFADDKLPSVWKLNRTAGEELEKAMTESLEMLRAAEEYGIKGRKFFGGEEIGMADIAFGGIALWLEVIEEVIGVKLLQEQTFPCLYAWTKVFMELPVIKENLPNRDDLFALLNRSRQKLLASS
ncbi:Glutathione transferase [Bertholletia excelsa]